MRPLPRPVVVLFLALAALLPPPRARAQEGPASPERSEAEFQRRWKKPAPEDKASAFRRLDPGRPESLPLLYDGFRFPHWLVRGAAAECASGIPEGPLRSQVRLDLLTHEEGPVRGGIAYAFAIAPLPGDGEAMAGALEDRNAWVRRDPRGALSGPWSPPPGGRPTPRSASGCSIPSAG